MGDFVMLLNALGLTQVLAAIVVAFAAIAVFFAFFHKA